MRHDLCTPKQHSPLNHAGHKSGAGSKYIACQVQSPELPKDRVEAGARVPKIGTIEGIVRALRVVAPGRAYGPGQAPEGGADADS